MSNINIWNFNETFTNDVVSFEQPGPDKQGQRGKFRDEVLISL